MGIRWPFTVLRLFLGEICGQRPEKANIVHSVDLKNSHRDMKVHLKFLQLSDEFSKGWK